MICYFIEVKAARLEVDFQSVLRTMYYCINSSMQRRLDWVYDVSTSMGWLGKEIILLCM